MIPGWIPIVRNLDHCKLNRRWVRIAVPGWTRRGLEKGEESEG